MKGHLNSGETYSLEQIFINGTNGKVVMPDLQRDYCWGGKGTLVADFVNNICDYSLNQKEDPIRSGLLFTCQVCMIVLHARRTEDEESPLAGIEQTELFFFSNDGGENTKKAMELLKVYLSE